MASGHSQSPVNLLALDGGGIRGVSELLILHEIMSRIQHDLALPELPRPCDYFHLIGGTSTGGLIALMVGRLRMNTKEALEHYNNIAGKTFSKKNRKLKIQDGAFKASMLEAEMKRVVAARSNGNHSLRMIDEVVTADTGRAVCAVAASNMEHPRRFRSYKVRENPEINCAIWEAARATTAAPTFFKRISIAEQGQIAEDILDAGIKCNNPAEEVIEEARLVFNDNRPVGCILSIGTGHPGTVGLAKPAAFHKVLPLELITVLKQIATSCEETANRLTRRFLERPDIYFRFSVTHGAGFISLEEWERMGEIKGHTEAYLRDPFVSKSIDSIVKILCIHGSAGGLSEDGSVTLGQICGRVTSSLSLRQVKFIQKPAFLLPFERDSKFTGRSTIIQDIEERIKTERGIALCGIGGIGKSQIAIEYCYVWKERNPNGHVFWVHASTLDRLDQAYKDIGRKLCLLGFDDPKLDTIDMVVNWLCKEENGPWLLTLDNADDIDMFFKPPRVADSLPRNSNGTIIITTRDKRVGERLVDGEEVIMIDPFSPEDAELLFRSKTPLLDNSSTNTIQYLLKELGFLPLAITQAAAFIKENTITVAEYTEELAKDDFHLQEYLFEDLPDLRRDSASVACPMYQEAFQVRMKVLGEKHPDTLVSMTYLALVLKYQGKYREAEETHRQELELSEKVSGKEHPGTLTSMNNLASVLDNQGKYKDAEQIHRQTLGLRERVLGKEHPGTLTSMNNLASVLGSQGKYKEAEQMYRQTLKLIEKVLGKEHSHTLSSLYSLASTLESLEKLSAAAALFRLELERCGIVYGPKHPKTIRSLRNLASLLEKQGKSAEADTIRQRVASLLEPDSENGGEKG